MNKYKVYVCLEHEFDEIVAVDEEDAFITASACAMAGGEWSRKVELLEEDITENE